MNGSGTDLLFYYYLSVDTDTLVEICNIRCIIGTGQFRIRCIYGFPDLMEGWNETG